MAQPPPLPAPGVSHTISLIHSDELEAEYMTVNPDEEDFDGGGLGKSPDWQARGPKKGPGRFVGGFMTGLKRLPRAMLKNRRGQSKPERMGTGDTAATWGTAGTGETLPRYQSPTAVDAPSSQVLYVEGTEMPRAEPSGAVSEVHSIASSQVPDRPRTPSARSQHPSPGHSPFTGLPEHQMEAQTPQPVYDGAQTSRPFTPYGDTHQTCETVLIHAADDDQAAELDSPLLVEPRPSSDYDKMSTPIHSPSRTSLNSRVIKVGHFIKRIYALPWMARRITSDYIPSQGPRAKYRKAPGTWYPKAQRTSIDLLANFQRSPSRRRSSHRRYHHRSPHAHRDRDRSLSPRHHGDQPHRRRLRYAPYEGLHVYPDGYASGYIPQPLFIYPPGDVTPAEPQPVYIIHSPPPPPDVHVIQPVPQPPEGDFYPRAMSRAPTIHH